MITKLNIFDFDGTLVATPTKNDKNIKKYERKTGLPWIIDKQTAKRLTIQHKKFIGMRAGWYGRPETLEPPLVPDPTPHDLLNQEIFNAWQKSKQDPTTLTRFVTGRHKGLRNHVLRICGDLGILDVSSKEAKDYSKTKPYKNHIYTCTDKNAKPYLLGDSGPDPKGPTGSPDMPRTTIDWKIWIIRQYIEIYNLEIVEVWEDREEHVEIFNDQNNKWGAKFIVNFVK